VDISELKYKAVHKTFTVAEDANYRGYYKPDKRIWSWAIPAVTDNTTRGTRKRRKAWTGGRTGHSGTDQAGRAGSTTEYGTRYTDTGRAYGWSLETEEKPPALVPQEPDESDDEAEDDDEEEEEEDDVPQVWQPVAYENRTGMPWWLSLGKRKRRMRSRKRQ
jgi:hypothetical protein